MFGLLEIGVQFLDRFLLRKNKQIEGDVDV